MREPDRFSFSLFGVIGLLAIIFCFLVIVLVCSFHIIQNPLLFLKSRPGEPGHRYTDDGESTHFGYTSTIPHRLLEENEYISYEDQENEINSAFHRKESYACKGTCYCTDSERRASVPLISRSVWYILLSISSVVAYQRAKSHFEDECIEQLSNECQVSSIQSTVEDCTVTVKVNEEENVESKKTGERRIYFCYGNCVKNSNHRIDNTRQQFENSGIDCGKLKQESEIQIYQSDLVVKSDINNLSQKYRQTAVVKFQKFHLVHFCKEKSRMEYLYEDIRSWRSGIYYQKRIGYRCVGRNLRQKHVEKGNGRVNEVNGVKSSFNNVRCRQIDPKPTSPNSEYWDRKFWGLKKDWDDGRIVFPN